MDPIAFTIGISWTLTGLLCIGLSIPLIRGRIRRNSLYGVRFPESFQSEEAWLAINRFGGRRLAAWAVPLVLVGLVCFFLPLHSHPAMTLVVGFAPLLLILIPLLQSWRFARRYQPRP